jgi:hypothetical protein
MTLPTIASMVVIVAGIGLDLGRGGMSRSLHDLFDDDDDDDEDDDGDDDLIS